MTSNTQTPKRVMAAPFTTVKIKCRPVIKAYLERNFGNPIRIPEEHILNKLLCSQLQKTNSRVDNVNEYPEEAEIIIYESVFRYDGFNMNNTNIRIFNVAVYGYMRDLWRFGLDGTLIAQTEHINFKKKYFELLQNSSGDEALIRKKIIAIKKELNEMEMNIQECIFTVITKFLKLDTDVLPMETVKKDYYRYRTKKFKHQLSSDIQKNN